MTRSMWLPTLSKKFYDSKEELGKDVVKILKQEIDNLIEAGVDIIQFDEPVLTEVVFSRILSHRKLNFYYISKHRYK